MEVWHTEARGQCCQRGWAQNRWRGWLDERVRRRSKCGWANSLARWRALARGRTPEQRLVMRTEFGWALKSEGCVVWKDTTQERHFECFRERRCWPRRVPGRQASIGGLDKVGDCPHRMGPWSCLTLARQRHSRPLGERDGKMAGDGPSMAQWRDDIQALATANNWSVTLGGPRSW